MSEDIQKDIFLAAILFCGVSGLNSVRSREGSSGWPVKEIFWHPTEGSANNCKLYHCRMIVRTNPSTLFMFVINFYSTTTFNTK